ncbi:MAG: hypothetical protein F2712_03835 [Actinobacteria bacterium]|uniref:Unannotated protein n=1 Tax=freshwater metagenome TaxID=449393 RepID=A0A6J6UPN1_9ZZZZ|nr:hypothetical protein [Actinomycetota bacterium]
MSVSQIFLICIGVLALLEVFYRVASGLNESPSGQEILVAHTNARYEPYDLVSRLEAVTKESGIHSAFWEEMQVSMKNQLFATATETTEGLIHDSADYEGQFFSTINGLRTTTDQPLKYDKSVGLFGGSTIYCYETEDSHTVSSHLQRLLKDSQPNTIVRNFGVAGAGAIERCRKIRHVVSTFTKSDDIILLFGDNDCGWLNYRASMSKTLKLSIRIAKLWRSLELVTLKSESKFARQHAAAAAKHTLEEIMTTYELCKRNGVRFTAVLQPNIYTKQELCPYESAVVKVFGARHKKMILSAYEIYRSQTLDFVVRAEDGFDNTVPSVFLDWAHVESRGNKCLANIFLKIIV